MKHRGRGIMRRDRSKFLDSWLKSNSRKPLVIRGARQVGKTWLIRDFAKQQGLELIELNFEKRPELESLFSSNDPQKILINLRAFTKSEIEPSKSLLFLDEIQASPHLLGKLRWFAEDAPQFPVIAAGSLLEFALAKHEFSMPVGRINYMYLEPLSFEEFLEANEQKPLKDYLEKYNWSDEIPIAIHDELLQVFKEYMLVGGMPEAVSKWIETKMPDLVNQVHFDLLATYRDDFAKYSGRLSTDRLEEVMSAVPRQLGNKFVYTKVNPGVSSTSLKQALDLLTKARVCHHVFATAANGLPLGTEVNKKYTKALMLDCGLCSAALGLTMHQLHTVTDLTLINSGSIAEQIVGQQLRTIFPPYVSPSLYYWQRIEKGGNSEVDYVLQHEDQVIPVEVKAGSTGSLKSLHQFIKEKGKKVAIRINSGFPSITSVNVKDTQGQPIEYTLLSVPFYLIGQLHNLLKIAP